MIHYPKEYEEALSRLNAPERSPLPYAPIPYGPVPNYCNYMNWNRIMAETRQGVLPKYSILQRIDLGSQNDLVMVSDAKEYTYTLDPSFTFAKGARKSIAVREVDIYNVIPNGQTKNAVEVFRDGFVIVFDVNKQSYGMEIIFSSVTHEISNDLPVSMNNFAQAWGKQLLQKAQADENDGAALFKDFYAYFEQRRRRIVVTLIADSSIEGLKITEVDESLLDLTHIHPYWDAAHSNMADYYNLDMSREETTKSYIYSSFGDRQVTFWFQLPASTLDVRQSAICGSINPWTKNNLIAPLTFTSDTLTKVFPWNGNTEVKFWFINEKGEKVRWRVVRGYIDLELIIDNTDSYAMDAH